VADAWDQHHALLLEKHIPETLWETLAGLAMAVVLGVLLAALMDFSRILRWLLYPLLVVSQTIPIFAIAILLILIFGFGSGPKITVVVLSAFFPITLNTFSGLQSADPACFHCCGQWEPVRGRPGLKPGSGAMPSFSPGCASPQRTAWSARSRRIYHSAVRVRGISQAFVQQFPARSGVLAIFLTSGAESASGPAGEPSRAAVTALVLHDAAKSWRGPGIY